MKSHEYRLISMCLMNLFTIIPTSVFFLSFTHKVKILGENYLEKTSNNQACKHLSHLERGISELR